MTTWTVTLVATGEHLGTVEAFTYEEALGRACVLATASGKEPARLRVVRQTSN